MSNERLRILDLIESGQISAEEGVRRLEGLGESAETAHASETSAPMDDQDQPAGQFPMSGLVRIAWQIVFGVGVVVLAVGGLLLARAYGMEGMPGLTFGWVLLVLGLVVLILGWWLKTARWFYLRVREHDGARFTIALPLPLGLVVALLRVAKPFVPQVQEMEADQLILAMRDELQRGRCFAVEVDEGDDGDQIQICFR